MSDINTVGDHIEFTTVIPLGINNIHDQGSSEAFERGYRKAADAIRRHRDDATRLGYLVSFVQAFDPWDGTSGRGMRIAVKSGCTRSLP